MQLKLIVSVLLIYLLSLDAYAFEGKGFKVLRETIESSPGTVGGFIQKTAAESSQNMFANSWAQAHDAQGRAHENIRLWSNHSFSITNYTSQRQIYTYKYEMNCDGQFFRKIDYVEVSPGGFVTDHADSYLYTNHWHSGTFPITAVTDVSGETGNNFVSRSILRVD